MTPYAVVLFCHSWIRWGVVGLGLVVFVRSVRAAREWSALDQQLGRAFLSALDMQAGLGLLLYFVLSPMTPGSIEALRASMPVPALRFFAIEHVTGMTLALAAAHLGWRAAKRASTDLLRRRKVAIGVGLALFAILASIPWPFLKYARPLVRGL